MDGTYYVGTSELYRSKDRGKTWELMQFEGMPLEMIETQDGSLLVGTYRGGIYRSIDQGKTWTKVGFENTIYIFKILQTADGTILTSATYTSNDTQKDKQTGVFISEDDGINWSPTSITVESIKGIFNPKPGLVFASGVGTDNFHRSLDHGKTWHKLVYGLPDSIPVSGMVEAKGTLFASLGDPQDAARTKGGGIYKSVDNGLNWVRSDKGLSTNTKVSDITRIGNSLFVSTGYPIKIGSRGIFKSDDLGRTWYPTGLNDLQLRLIRSTSDKQLVVGSNVSSIFISDDQGKSWLQTGKEIENWTVFQVVENNNYLLSSGESGIWRAKIPVRKWEHIKKELGSLVKLSNGDMLLAENGVILKTTDYGDTWEQISNLGTEMTFLYEIDSTLLIACAQQQGIYYSTNLGRDWQQYHMGEFENSQFRSVMKTSNGTLLIGTSGGILRSTDHGKTWNKVDDESYIWSFVESDQIIYAGGYARGVSKSTDDGATWEDFNEGIKNADQYVTVTSLLSGSDNSIICGTLGEGIYKLKNTDKVWTGYKNGLEDQVNFGIVEGDNGELFATSEKGIYRRKL